MQSAIILTQLPLEKDFPVYGTNLLNRIFTVIMLNGTILNAPLD